MKLLRRLTLTQARTVGIDALFVLALTGVSMAGLGATYTESEYWWIAMIGAVLAVVSTVVVAVMLRWPSVVAALLVVVWYFLLGPVLCLRVQDPVPGPSSWRLLVDETLFGWKDLLTTLPPVDGESRLLVLPWVLGLLAGLLGTSLSLVRSRRPLVAGPLPLLPLLALLALVILLGLNRPHQLWLQGGVFAVLALAWLGLRYARTSAPVRSTQGKLVRIGTGAALVGVAGLLSMPVGTWASGGDAERVILRSHVDPPFDVGQYPSPLASFRRYVQLPNGREDPRNLHDTALFRIEGVPAGSRVRLAVLDRYDGVVWGASNDAQPTGSPGAAEDTYQRVSSVIDNPVTGTGVDARVTIGPGWNGVWLPTLGALQSLSFDGPDRETLSESFRYNLATSSAVVPAGLHPGDVYTFTAVQPDETLTPQSTSSGFVGAAGDAAGFLDTQAVQWSEGESQPMRRVFAVARHLKTEGKYSDGVIESEKIYHAGHNRFRLTDDTGGVNAPFVVGNDEQYAAWMALLANRIGVPARVVFGAVVPDGGTVTGADVHAWVEVQVADGTWHTLPTDLFMDKDRPAEQQTTRRQDQSGSVVPPPAPIPPPSTAGEQNDADMKVRKNKSTTKGSQEAAGGPISKWVQRALVYLGLPLLAITILLSAVVLAKLLRRRRRRTRSKVSSRFVGAWRELVDHARDLGQPVPVGAGVTRREQSRRLGTAGAGSLAQRADSHVFGPRVPRPRDAESFWQAIDAERQSMSGEVSVFRRVRAALNLTTFRR
ncbi:MAG: transglutaminase domain-containing protein [Nocardioides sp.]